MLACWHSYPRRATPHSLPCVIYPDPNWFMRKVGDGLERACLLLCGESRGNVSRNVQVTEHTPPQLWSRSPSRHGGDGAGTLQGGGLSGISSGVLVQEGEDEDEHSMQSTGQTVLLLRPVGARAVDRPSDKSKQARLSSISPSSPASSCSGV